MLISDTFVKRRIKRNGYETYTVDTADGYITCLRWDGDTHYYDVFDSAEDRDAEQQRLDRIDEEYRKAKNAYLDSLAF